MHQAALRLLFTTICALPLVSHAQDSGGQGSRGGNRPSLMGELSLSDTREKPKDPQQEGAKEVGAWAEKLQAIVCDTGKGEVPAVEKNGADYLAALYLYCISRSGPCPFVLEAILESEVVDARTHSEVRCGVMTRFWKSWLSMDMEARSKYSLSISHGLEMAEFNSRHRPRFVSCKDTVTAIVSSDDVEQRYGKDGTTAAPISKLVNLLREVRDNNIDLFATTGVQGTQK